jgi:tetratricopeptide (TPR) repeat protein
MAEIFISYASQQRDVTRALAATIEAEYGIGSVWWDQAGLRGGDQFSPEITRALDDAKAVVVVWTHGAVTSDWVYAEGVRAAGQRKVVTVRAADLDPNLIPLPFNVFHTCVVDDISAVLAGIAKRLSGEASELPSALPGRGFLLDPEQEALPARASVRRPASLLLAKHRLVPFEDIHGLRAEFVQWATGAPAHALGSPALGRLVHVAAGLGKTRAPIEIADELVRAHGWLAGFVPRDIRGAGRELSECSLGGDAYDEIEIPDRIARPDRQSLFAASVKAFLAHRSPLGAQPAEPRAPAADLIGALYTGDDYDRPLAVQIAALLHVHGVDTERRHGMAHLLDLILGLEYEHWDKALKIADQPIWQAAVKNGVARVTLVGGVDSERAAALIAGDPLFREARDIDVPSARRMLSLIFPGADGGLDALEPDLIGEHHVLECIGNDVLVDTCLDWAGENREPRRRILTMLNRATRAEHGAKASRAEAQLARLVATRAGVLGGDLIRAGLETPGRLLELCAALEAQIDNLDENALAEIDSALPLQSMALMALALRVAERLADLARKFFATVASASPSPDLREDALHDLAGQVHRFGIRLSNLGRREEALAASQEAVEIDRRLAQIRPDAFLPDLAISLTGLGAHLSNLGRREDALAASQEALDIYRRLAQTCPGALLPDLASSLNNLGLSLSTSGAPRRRWPRRKRPSTSIGVWHKPAPTPSCPISQ